MNPYRIRIYAREGLKENSDILINQIRALSKTRIKEKVATSLHLSDEVLCTHRIMG